MKIKQSMDIIEISYYTFTHINCTILSFTNAMNQTCIKFYFCGRKKQHIMDTKAFYQLSYGVYIIASGCADEKNAFVANTAIQVTSDPTQIAVACNKNNHTAKFIEVFKNFSVSIVKQDFSPSVLNNYGFHSGRDINKFEKSNYILGKHTNVPIVLDDAVAWFECKLAQQVDVGSHILFIGQVVDAVSLSNEKPLTYSYYHEVKGGKTPKNAPHGVSQEENPKNNNYNNQKSSIMKNYVCKICGYIYNPTIGDPDGGIEPGTPFEDIPDDWTCPMCGVTKADFEPEI